MKKYKLQQYINGDLQVRDRLLTMLELAHQNENQLRNAVRNTLKFYSTTLSSVIGGTFFISKDIEDMLIKSVIFCIGGVIVMTLACIGYAHYKSDYRRQVEQIVIQAKVEDQLGFTNIRKYGGRHYWKGEPLIPNIYIETRQSYDNSNGFINWFLKGTDMFIIKIFFGLFMISGFALLLVSVYTFIGQ